MTANGRIRFRLPRLCRPGLIALSSTVVLVAAPGRVEFSGGPPSEDAMVLTGWWPAVGGPGKDAWVRMTYTRRDDGSVRQHGELSEDHGLTWGPAFDLLYRPKPAD